MQDILKKEEAAKKKLKIDIENGIKKRRLTNRELEKIKIHSLRNNIKKRNENLSEVEVWVKIIEQIKLGTEKKKMGEEKWRKIKILK